jgi:hypothetical protein
MRGYAHTASLGALDHTCLPKLPIRARQLFPKTVNQHHRGAEKIFLDLDQQEASSLRSGGDVVSDPSELFWGDSLSA